MGANPPGPAPAPRPQTMFSPDGFWWWDGTQWKAAVSADRLWRWNGQAWEPNRQLAPPPRSGGGGGTATAVILTVLGVFAVLILVSIMTIVILLTMGNQIGNVFANVVTALGASPSPSP
jgi:hypothetical protein